MFRYALRRVLWSIPTLFVTTLALFFVSALAGDNLDGNGGAEGPETPESNARGGDATRVRFSELPLFFNGHPRDVRALAEDAVRQIAVADERRSAARELAWLGGAALPYVLPELDALEPNARRRVAIALTPVAERMGVSTAEELANPETAALFWSRFWSDRALDYTKPVAARAVSRLVEHESALREDDLIALDTFALPEIMTALSRTRDASTQARLTQLAAHASGRGSVLAPDAPRPTAERVVQDWREWWFVVGSDFQAMEGGRRALALFSETRYCKWLARFALGELGTSSVDGTSIAAKLQVRAPMTVALCGSALGFALLVALPVGAYCAVRRSSRITRIASALMFALHVVPVFLIVEAIGWAADVKVTPDGQPHAVNFVVAVVALVCLSVPVLERTHRAAMLDVLGDPVARTARSKGASERRVIVLHGFRRALGPTATAAAAQWPVLFGGAVIVEPMLGLAGAGRETLLAARAHDVPWLMAVLVVGAAAATVSAIAGELLQGLLDPRVRDGLGGAPAPDSR